MFFKILLKTKSSICNAAICGALTLSRDMYDGQC